MRKSPVYRGGHREKEMAARSQCYNHICTGLPRHHWGQSEAVTPHSKTNSLSRDNYGEETSVFYNVPGTRYFYLVKSLQQSHEAAIISVSQMQKLRHRDIIQCLHHTMLLRTEWV